MDQESDWIDQSGWLRFWVRIFPEITFFKSREELREAKKVFRKRFPAPRHWWPRIALLAAVAALISGFGVNYLQSLNLSLVLCTIITLSFSTSLGIVGGLFLWYRPYIRFVRQYLQEQGIPVCLKCGYDLRGQTEARCPECASAFDEKLLESP